MKPNKILVLALASLMLAVVGTANVFAYSWSGSDSSNVQSQNYVKQVSIVPDAPSVHQGNSATWANSLYDDDSSTAYYMSLIGWFDGAGVQKSTSQVKLTYHSTPSKPDGYTSGQEGLGKNTVSNSHAYIIGGTSGGPNTWFDQTYYVYN